MCGITGKIFLEPGRKMETSELRQMTDSISHRGPDDEGFFTSGPVGFGFRRLSIIDLSHGRQPICNEDGTVWIVFNGEIYNYQELQSDLKSRGHVFKTQSDTETIVHLYEQYGTDCVNYLRGMFGFAIWDEKKQQLFCARDRFGIKPLYYYFDDQQFVFGSEIKTILRAQNVNNDLSTAGLYSYFAFNYISSDLSIFKHIKKLQPAHWLLLSLKDNHAIKIERYWDIRFTPNKSKSEAQWVEELQASLAESVKMHMVADVPLGAFLSGGIDSSATVAMMARASSRPIKTFSIGFKDDPNDELKNAELLAKKYGCEHHVQMVEPESVSLLPKMVQAFDEPFGDSSAIPTYYVSKFAREYVTVALSGDGGDELFAGYDIYKYFTQLRRYSSGSPTLNKAFWGSLNNLIPRSVPGKGSTYFLSKDRNLLGAFLTSWPLRERRDLVLKSGRFGKNDLIPEEYKKAILLEGMEKGNDFLSNLQYLDMRTFMVDDVLTKVDRTSMLSSLEVRVPILDHQFAELSFSIPSSLKLKNGVSKYIFKKSLEEYLPATILNKPKSGFVAPISSWFKDELEEYVNDTLLSDQCKVNNYLDKKQVQLIVKESRKSSRDFSGRIWALLFFEEWLKQNILP